MQKGNSEKPEIKRQENEIGKTMHQYHSPEEIYSLFKKHRHVCTDTRKAVEGSIFFALKGGNFDANDFALQALEKGCAYAVVDNPSLAGKPGCLLVENVLDTLQKTATLYRKQMMIPVVGITGTNGKTTTKELLRSVLGMRFRTFATEGNLNNHIGVPLSLLSMPQDTEIAIIEMGANHPGEIAALCRIALPTFGIITNIGQAHLEGFGSLSNIVKTKTALYRFVKKVNGKVFVNAADPVLMEASANMERYCYGEKSNVFLQITPLEDEQLRINCCLHGTPSAPNLIKIKTNLIGRYNLENVGAAACAGRYFGINDEEIGEGIARYMPKNLRSQSILAGSNLLIADAYNANPSSMKAALENFATMQTQTGKLPVIGDMLELGPAAGEAHQKVIAQLSGLGFRQAILVGSHFARTDHPEEYLCFPDVEKLLAFWKKEPPQSYCIFVKGSHGIHLEKAIDFLEKLP